jgi:hypothetical protein
MVMSDDGSVIAGWGLGTQYFAGWVLEIKTAFVCHVESPSIIPQTISVPFPVSFDQHLGHGTRSVGVLKLPASSSFESGGTRSETCRPNTPLDKFSSWATFPTHHNVRLKVDFQ